MTGNEFLEWCMSSIATVGPWVLGAIAVFTLIVVGLAVAIIVFVFKGMRDMGQDRHTRWNTHYTGGNVK